MGKNNNFNLHSRRDFLAGAGALAGLSVLASLPGAGFAEQLGIKPAGLTVKQVIDAALSETETLPKSVDKLIIGNPDQEVTGIVTTTFPTIDVINKAIKAGANMIISHEGAFYMHDDQPAYLKESDVCKYKTDLLTKNNIAIWRFHDSWHAHKPDGIVYGNLVSLGWAKYYNPAKPRMITLPQPMTVAAIIALCKKKINAPQVRLIGELNKPCKTIYFAPGAVLSAEQIPDIQKEKPDLILSGESREWETCQRVRDGLAMGLNTKLVILGHDVSEEAGMDYAAAWLAPKVKGVKVTYIAAGTPFQYV